MRALALIEAAWTDPVAAATAVADEPYALLLLSDGSSAARWSYLMWAPERTVGAEDFAAAATLLGPPEEPREGPPFQGGLAGLAAYEFGARLEPAMPQARDPRWPDVAAGLYLAVFAFDHQARTVTAVGRGASQGEAEERARRVLQRLDQTGLGAPSRPGALGEAFSAAAPGRDYEAAVAEVVEAIGRGEIFQANVARAWTGRLSAGARPADVLARLASQSSAGFAGYLRLPGLALVSNSPERFVHVRPEGGRLRATTEPIKGTRARGDGAAADAALAAELQSSGKDRAENLMIVDLMRNDLSRVCEPGTVQAPELFRLQSLANVHHLVSTVTGVLAPGRTALDLFAAAFPPGSVTGSAEDPGHAGDRPSRAAARPLLRKPVLGRVRRRLRVQRPDPNGGLSRGGAGLGVRDPGGGRAGGRQRPRRGARGDRGQDRRHSHRTGAGVSPRLSPHDRGFALGDGLFETVLSQGGELAFWDRHMARLEVGCAALGLPPPEQNQARRAAEDALRVSGLENARAGVRLTWTAGEGGRGLDRPGVVRPALFATAAAAPEASGEVRLITSRLCRNESSPTSRLKTLAYLDNVLARREAQGVGADDALLLNTRGEAACATAANLFWIEGEVVCTPALECGVLAGVTRAVLIERLRAQGVVVAEVTALRARLDGVAGLFLTNSLIGVRAAASLDGDPVAPHPLVEVARGLLA
jgi:para-aminobenzoate synthetase component 1